MNQRLLQSVGAGDRVCGASRIGVAGRVGGAGFTIIELLVVSAIIALLAGATFRMSAKRHRRVLVEKCAREICLAARYARIFAVEKQRSCKLVFDKEQKRFYLYGSVQAGGEPDVISSVYSRPGTLSDRVNFEQIKITPTGSEYGDDAGGDAGGDAVVVFRADGTADGAVLVVGDGEYHYIVSIAAGTGRAKVRLYNANEDEDENYQTDVIDLDEYQ